MSMLLKMSWRNLWRNRKRTAITAVALVIALVLMIVYNGLTRGVSRQLQRTITHVTIGDYQIHHRQYLQELSIYDSLIDYQRLLENLRQRHLTAAPRWYGYGLIANDKTMKSVGVEIQAVDLKLEPQVSDLPRAENFLQGQYLKAGSNKNEIVLGKKVAEALTVKVGDPLVLVTTAADGSIGNEMFQVVGILKSIGDTWDRTRVIMEQGSFMRLFAFPADQAHEIAIRTDGVKFSRTQQSELETILPAQAEIKSWSH
jgi:ABC-type lipoprotein release transport system permease subunit